MRCTKSILGVVESTKHTLVSSSSMRLYGSLSTNTFICKLAAPLTNYDIGFIIQGFIKVNNEKYNIDLKASIENNLVSMSGNQEGMDFIKLFPGPGYIEIRGFVEHLSLEIRIFPMYGFISYEWSTNPILKST